LKRIADAHDRAIAFKPIDVGRSWSEAGSGQPLGNRPQVLQDYRLVELPRWAAWRNVPLNSEPKHFPTPFLMSSGVTIVARQAGTDVFALTQALMRGCWADELNISDADTVADEMSANTDEALAASAWSVPSIVVDGELFFGQDRLEMIAWRLDGGGR
jgi:carboxymethylenebutenolidase